MPDVGTLTLDQLYVFLTVVETGSFAAAGRRLGRATSAISYTVANLEHHHFKHDEHRRAGDAHVHFFGADLFSFKDRLRLEDGDVMVYTINPFLEEGVAALFVTHPPVADRVQRLRALDPDWRDKLRAA